MTWEALSKAQPELLILISGFDDTFDDNVHARHSYDCNDIVWGAKFVKVFSSDTEGRPIVNLALLDKYDDVQINHLISKDDYEAENSAS